MLWCAVVFVGFYLSVDSIPIAVAAVLIKETVTINTLMTKLVGCWEYARTLVQLCTTPARNPDLEPGERTTLVPR